MKWPVSAIVEVADLQREAGPGRCPFCLAVLPPRKPRHKARVICPRANCASDYQAAYKRARRGTYEPVER